MSLKPRHTITVHTGSRLHFGLTRVRPHADGKIGGVGVMIEEPGTRLVFRPATAFRSLGPQRMESLCQEWCRYLGVPLNQFEVEQVSGPPTHSGLGSGTQLAHAIAAGLNRFFQCPSSPPDQIANCLQRGQRSMIGSYGFAHGGLIVDGGQGRTDAKLEKQCLIPRAWKLVLVLPFKAKKKFGVAEKSAFDTLQDNPRRSRILEDLIRTDIVRAAEQEQFSDFCAAVHEYGKLSGEFYTSVQGGIYNGAIITSVVERLLRLQAKGVGQSSWGPVVYSWCESAAEAADLLERVRNACGPDVRCWISGVRNIPADVLLEQVESEYNSPSCGTPIEGPSV